MPPVSKQTPLPTKAIGWASPALPPFHLITASWLSRTLPWPTPSSVPMPSFSISASPRISTSRPRLSSAFTRRANSAGIEDVGRLGHQIAREERRRRPRPTAARRRLRRPVTSEVTTRMVVDRGNLVGLLLGQVFVEAIGGQTHGEGDAGGLFGRQMRGVDGQDFRARQLHGLIGGGGGGLDRQVVQLVRRARADQQHRVGVDARRSRHGQAARWLHR